MQQERNKVITPSMRAKSNDNNSINVLMGQLPTKEKDQANWPGSSPPSCEVQEEQRSHRSHRLVTKTTEGKNHISDNTRLVIIGSDIVNEKQQVLAKDKNMNAMTSNDIQKNIKLHGPLASKHLPVNVADSIDI